MCPAFMQFWHNAINCKSVYEPAVVEIKYIADMKIVHINVKIFKRGFILFEQAAT